MNILVSVTVPRKLSEKELLEIKEAVERSLGDVLANEEYSIIVQLKN